ncbi:RDD family protein [Brachybacterium endophyticum]|nr:RDD family protein [Brachybacterium endophyticum]
MDAQHSAEPWGRAPAPSSGQVAAGDGRGPLAPPLDGCAPGGPGKRILAYLIDGVASLLIALPLWIGVILVAFRTAPTAATILCGVGVALPLAYALVVIWLQGSKGFTPGTFILGLRVVREDTSQPLGFVRALGRYLVFWALSWLMGLSVFLDPRGHGRGFHDRMVGGIVVDVRKGRNPLLPRPDDFERPGAAEYLGRASVPVDVRENLTARPGAAWESTGGDAAAAEQEPARSEHRGQDAQPARPSADGDVITSSPWAPPREQSGPPAPQASSAQAPAAQAPSGGEAEPARRTTPSSADAQQGEQHSVGHQDPPAVIDPWAPPGAAPSPSVAPSSSVDPGPSGGPGPSIDPDRRAEAPQVPVESSEPAAATPPGSSAAWTSSPSLPTGAASPDDARGTAAAGPSDASPSRDGQPVAAAGVEESTRAAQAPVDDDLGDLEATRISPLRRPTYRLRLDDGTVHEVRGRAVLGRNPLTQDDLARLVVADDTRSVSKNHLRIEAAIEGLTVEDLGSTNGSAVILADGTRQDLDPHTPMSLPDGAALAVGDRTFTVERMQ